MTSTAQNPLEKRLKAAEEAETEVMRLGTLASEAPQLRAELAKSQRHQERAENRRKAMDEARASVRAAGEKQAQVPAMLETVSQVVYSFYTLLKEIDTHRKDAFQALTIADRMDYENDLETQEEEQKAVGREPIGLEYLCASKHGEAKVRQLLEDMDPAFNYLKDCNLSDPINRDMANFVLSHAIHRTRHTAPPQG